MAPFYHLVRVVVKVVAGLMGYLVGFAVGGTQQQQQRQPVSRDQRIPRPAWGPDLGMMDDEYL